MSSLRILKNFKLSQLADYIKRFPYYARGVSYYRYIDFLKKHGIRFGVVKGTNENYIFEINDRCIPYEMFRRRETYSQNDIKSFFTLAKRNTDFIGGYFLDIGANIGTTSIYVSKNIDPSLRILAFEPDILNFQMLAANCVLNGCKNIEPLNIALSDHLGSMQMFVDDANRANSKILSNLELRKRGEKLEGRKMETIKTCRLDDFLSERRIKKEDIHYIWMDVEGHEAYAIEGMMELLTNYKPHLFMEFTCKDNFYVNVSEEDFKLLYKNLSSVYQKVIITKLTKEKNHGEFPIEYLQELFYKTKEQYNIFLY